MSTRTPWSHVLSHLPRLAAVVVAAMSVGCTLVYFTTSDPEGLLCGPEGGPRCEDGFACVLANDGKERCARAGFKDVGEECVDSAECKDGGICADAYAEGCPDGSSDINCQKSVASDPGLRCRAPCDEDTFACDNARCFFFEGVEPFCQKGTCATDSDCEGGADPAICVDESGGRSGLCQLSCDPIACFDGDCPCLDGDACAMPADEFVVSTRNVCTQAGTLVAGDTCNVLNPCAVGHSCVFRNDGTAVCVQWCRVGGGAPSCNAGVCQNVAGGAELGICQ